MTGSQKDVSEELTSREKWPLPQWCAH